MLIKVVGTGADREFSNEDIANFIAQQMQGTTAAAIPFVKKLVEKEVETLKAIIWHTGGQINCRDMAKLENLFEKYDI